MIENFKQRIINWDGKVDTSLNELENLLLQFNHANNSAFTEEQIEFGTPLSLNTNSPSDPGYNTEPISPNTGVEVTPKQGTKIEFVDIFKYRRILLDFQWRLLGGTASLALPREADTADKVEAYVKKIMPYIPGSVLVSLNDGAITIKAKENSYIYYGEITVAAEYPPGIMDKISDNLVGFDYTSTRDIQNANSFTY